MSSGPRAGRGAARQQASSADENQGLADYIDNNRTELEALANEEYPISRVLQALLDRRDRGDL